MKQLTRQEVEAVVEALQNPNPSLYRPNCHNDTIKCTDCIYIGTVLEKISKGEWNRTEDNDDIDNNLDKVMKLWQPLGFSKSLQEIVKVSGWEYYIPELKACDPLNLPKRLKSPEANALFSFLIEIGL